jgi:hypothetical protein
VHIEPRTIRQIEHLASQVQQIAIAKMEPFMQSQVDIKVSVATILIPLAR